MKFTNTILINAVLLGQSRAALTGGLRGAEECENVCVFQSRNNVCCPGYTCVWFEDGDLCLPAGTCIEEGDGCQFDARVGDGDTCCEGLTCINDVCTSPDDEEPAPEPEEEAPEECPAGSFGSGGNDCELCPNRTFSSQPGSASCEDCPPNSVAKRGATECEVCEDGFEPTASGKVCFPIQGAPEPEPMPEPEPEPEASEPVCTDRCVFLARENDCCPGNICVWFPDGDECRPDGTCIPDGDECKFDARVGDSCCDGSSCVDDVCMSDDAAPEPEPEDDDMSCNDRCRFRSNDPEDGCCDDYECVWLPSGDVCQPEGTCIAKGDECKYDATFGDSCCPGYECVDDICH